MSDIVYLVEKLFPESRMRKIVTWIFNKNIWFYWMIYSAPHTYSILQKSISLSLVCHLVERVRSQDDLEKQEAHSTRKGDQSIIMELSSCPVYDYGLLHFEKKKCTNNHAIHFPPWKDYKMAKATHS